MKNTDQHKTRRLLGSLVSGFALLTGVSACASAPASDPYTEARPAEAPARSQTNFTESLTCMDNMLYAHGIRDIRLTTNGIPDSTGEIQSGTREMLISAVSRMSSRSRAFTFIDFQEVSAGFGPPEDRRFYDRQQSLLTPTYYVRGAVTTFDDSVVSDSKGAGVRFAGAGGGVNVDATSSVVGVDMNVGEVQTGLILPGVVSSNRISVTRRGQSVDASFDVELGSESLGAFAQRSRNRSEGMHTAVRTLIELNTIETLGKLARVPYWRCLGIDQADPEAAQQASQYFNAMSDAERVEFAQRSLKGLSLYNGAIDGVANASFRDAVGRYQSDNDLVATGAVDLQFVASLLGRDIELAGTGKPVSGLRDDYASIVSDQLYISMSDALEFPTYQVNMPLQMRVRLNSDAYLYCFYRDGSGSIARIFPNRFQPNALVSGGKVLKVPGEQAGFALIFEQPASTEEVKCFASRTEIGVGFPEDLKQGDLTPVPYEDLPALEQAIRANAPADLSVNSVEFLVR